ncbi:MAG: hypothetical protein A2Z14_04220 [Chloroflexi bacterium RBG_16_48_8]|nr:MAG: hypothetical protein A2Z14_04220 [Chloroflexi bacterium RBG_16_48_8]
MSDTAIPAMDPSVPNKFLPFEDVSFLKRFWVSNRTALLFIIGIAVFLLFWEWEARYLKIVEPFFIPPISEILAALKENLLNGEIPKEMAWSLRNWAGGWLIGAGLGIPLGLTLGSFPILNKILSPYLWILWVTPRIAFLPIVIMALGFGPETKILFISISCFFQVVVPTTAGVLTVKPSYVRVGRLFGGSRIQVYRKIVLPYALNFIVTGLRLAARSGMMVMYSTEMFGSAYGIGTWVILQSELFYMEAAFAGLICLIIVSVSIIALIDFIDNRMRPWKSEVSI